MTLAVLAGGRKEKEEEEQEEEEEGRALRCLLGRGTPISLAS